MLIPPIIDEAPAGPPSIKVSSDSTGTPRKHRPAPLHIQSEAEKVSVYIHLTSSHPPLLSTSPRFSNLSNHPLTFRPSSPASYPPQSRLSSPKASLKPKSHPKSSTITKSPQLPPNSKLTHHPCLSSKHVNVVSRSRMSGRSRLISFVVGLCRVPVCLVDRIWRR